MNLKRSVAERITDGYLLMMAVFFLAAVPAIQWKWTLSKLAWIWILLVGILLLTMASVYKAYRELPKQAVHKGVLVIMLASIICSIGFTRPYAQDATLEIVNTAVATDSMYQYNEYTGYLDEHAIDGHAFSPIEMLYASLIKLSGMESAVILYYVVPFILIIVFFAGLWRLGNVLLKDDRQVAGFVAFATVIFWMTTYLQDQSVITGIFLNSWNGLTWLSCFVMPVALANCLEFMNQAMEGNADRILYKAVMAVVLVLAAQLTDSKGGFYVVLMLFLTVAVILVRKGYDYGITSSRFKKRV